MDKEKKLTVIPSSDQKAMGLDLMNDIRALVNSPKYDHMTVKLSRSVWLHNTERAQDD